MARSLTVPSSQLPVARAPRKSAAARIRPSSWVSTPCSSAARPAANSASGAAAATVVPKATTISSGLAW
ncbi:hypothetical protein ACFQ0M_11085 [Kitasatospora aburaviensis]